MNAITHHRGYSTMYREASLTLGLFFAIESYSGAVPDMMCIRDSSWSA